MRYIRLTAMLLLAACGDGGTTPTSPPTPPTPVATSITLSATSLSFSSLGATQQLTATVKDQNGATMSGASVTWATSSASAATVSSTGLVTAVADGTTTITATSGSASGTAAVTVAQAAASIVLSDTVLSFASLGDSIQLTAVVKDLKSEEITGASVTWATSSTSVATVSSGLVTSVADGTATITVTSGSASASASVSVQQLANSITLSSDSLGLGPAGDTATVTATVKDEVGSIVSDPSVTWATSDASVATVSSIGLVLAVANGTATITATSGSVSQTATVTVDPTYTSISAGLFHSCGVRRSGDGYCWGYNANGRLGDGTTIQRTKPVLVSGGYEWTSISAGGHSCGLTTAGDAYCWGDNESGQLGDGTTTGRTKPVRVSGGHTWASVSSGTEYTCGLTTAGDAYCWGKNSDGVLGIGSRENRSIPTLVADGHTWVSINSGTRHTCGATTQGDGYCWGWNAYGQLGDGYLDASTYVDTIPNLKVKDLGNIASISPGGIHSCALTTGSEGYCWGNNMSGQVGNGSFAAGRYRGYCPYYTWCTDYGPVTRELIKGLHTWASMISGDTHTCAVKATGELYCWGLNSNGRLGIGNTTLRRSIPTLVAAGHTWASVSAGGSHTCGVTTAGGAYCWGSSQAGQLGNSSLNNSGVPAKVIWN